MSEAISAFSAYNKGGAKPAGAKKSAAKAKNQTKANNFLGKKAAGTATKAKATATTKASIGKAKNNIKTSPKPAATKTGAATRNVSNGTKGKATSSGTAAVTKTVTNGKSNGTAKNYLGPHNVDAWVAELFDDAKKLTKAQEKRKTELQTYLMKEIQEKEEEEARANDRSDLSEEGTATDDTYSDEYTINSYDSDDENVWSDMSDEDEESVANAKTNTATAVKSNSKAAKTADAPESVKRKSMEDANISNGSKDKATKTTTTSAAGQNKKSKLSGPNLETEHTQQQQQKAKPTNKQRQSPVKTTTKRSSTGRTSICSIVKSEPASPPPSVVHVSSIEDGKRTFAWLLNPVTPEKFFEAYWERNACLIKRKNPDMFSSLISFAAIDKMLIDHHIEFTTNIDVTSYKKGERQTHNPEGRAMPPTVWSHYGDGCSIRLLNPHTYLPKLFKLNATLQEYFHCLVGANAYLTPPNSQGFAPHFDDIEAFVLQVEGRKRWKLYEPIRKHDMLARVSSHNYKPNEIGQPIFDDVLMPGDLLYFPRGTIHQACTEPGYHSLHITLSVYQKQAYADLLEQLLPQVLQSAITTQLDVRRGLPLHTFQHLGLAHVDADSKERYEFQEHIKTLVSRHLLPTAEHIDAAVDQLAKKYQREALPPELHAAEHMRTIYGSRSCVDSKGQCLCDYELTLRTNVRLLRAHILRLVREDGGKLRVYFHVDNAREYCKYEPTFMEIEPNEAATIELLVRSYPAYVGVSQFPMRSDDRKMDVATALWERGLLMTEQPFK